MLSEGGKLLELRLALLREGIAKSGRQNGALVGLLSCRTLDRHDCATLGGVNSYGKKSKPLDLDQGSGTIRYVEHSLNDLASAPSRFIRKLWHNQVGSNTEISQKLRYSKRQFT